MCELGTTLRNPARAVRCLEAGKIEMPRDAMAFSKDFYSLIGQSSNLQAFLHGCQRLPYPSTLGQGSFFVTLRSPPLSPGTHEKDNPASAVTDDEHSLG
ncbi:hypothetical protein PG985_000807 [Apiospora marii]|uniref:Uncharacterized protein n=1 Tax=Apiospora marii TaxID=335849 RepID=A0ABR1R3W0_9PEZI